MTRRARHLDLNPLTGTREQTTLEQDLERSLQRKIVRSVSPVGTAWEHELAELARLLEQPNDV